MKKILMLVIVCLPVFGMGQKDLAILPEIDGVPTYSEVIVVDSISQAELYNRAKLWFVDNYNSAKNVLQMEDKEAGIIAGKGIIPVELDLKIDQQNSTTVHEKMDVYHTIKIYVKKGKFKYIVTDLKGSIYFESIGAQELPLINSGYKGQESGQLQVLNAANEAIIKTIESLKIAMTKRITDTEKW